MLFNSTPFLVFLAVVFCAYYFLGRRGQNLWLLLASYFFYGWWDWRFCSLLILSTLLDYTCGLQIAGSSSIGTRRKWLFASVAGNLTVLGLFKYFNFFRDSIERALHLFGMPLDWPTAAIILPIGISFYTFQSMSYTLDVYRREMKPTRNLIDFALYVSFFPQLVAGPIERASRLLSQFAVQRQFLIRRIVEGLSLMLMGYVKKLAIADYLAPLVDERFANIASFGSAGLISGLFMFSLQIYGDFSGYSDIARGAARLFGIELVVNFKQPYFSRSISEFWRRWHISLSSWLRDYVYIPLGGNRSGPVRTHMNLLVTMLLGGLWHGASWTFVVWGALHGIYLSIERILRGARLKTGDSQNQEGMTVWQWFGSVISSLAIFSLVSFTWLFFRANTFQEAWLYLETVLAFKGGLPFSEIFVPLFFAVVMCVFDIPQRWSGKQTIFLDWHWFPRGVWLGVCILMLMIFHRGEALTPFIYFQF